MKKIGIIGGSGLYQLDGIENIEDLTIMDTPFGQPSDHFMTGVLEGVDVVFLARHGKGHRISPSCINYRANIFEMKRLGVEAIISVSACGSLREEMKPMDFVVPDQFIDRTNRGREASFRPIAARPTNCCVRWSKGKRTFRYCSPPKAFGGCCSTRSRGAVSRIISSRCEKRSTSP